ncbi:MAG: N-acetylmuramoyl-L-alanine amidase [Lachnospiraceae bacterium]|nr:N-acetylmuramoyl-L-alanine amidase [Lachnospiraceae bacterium]
MAIRIYVDQGHNPAGNVNAGAVGNGLNEGDITYNVGAYLADLLDADNRFLVRTSRNTPTEVLGTSNASSLAIRVRQANEWPADYFISIHANASTNPAANGSEMYVYKENSTAATLAEYILDAMVTLVGTRDNGVRTNPSLYVLRRTSMPAVLVELAYITNAQDAEKLRYDQYNFAYSIYIGLLRYLGLQEQ